MLRFSPMHHEKYVLVVVPGSSRKMERTREDSAGSALIVGKNFVRRNVLMHRESSGHTLMENKPMHRLHRA